jgi:glycosyltransferase involved in cell wall biosynthesis
MKPKISVIVPIYNTKNYLDKCLQSIINQTMQEIEIICIDDCSPDDSYLIVERFMAQDSRVSLIRHEKNKGSGGARNTGILAAKADFLASVDSDDYIKPEMMQTLWDFSENGKYDVVSCGYICTNTKGEEISFDKPISEVLINKKNSVDIFTCMNVPFWNKLWRRSLFVGNKIYFPEKLFFQDSATTPRIIAKSQTIKTIENELYYYLIRPDSVTTTNSPKHIIDQFKVLEILLEFLEQNNLIGCYWDDFVERIDRGLYYHSVNAVQSLGSDKEIEQYLRKILFLKAGFLSYRDELKGKKKEELLKLIQSNCNYSLIEKAKYRYLGLLLKPFLTPKHHLKLKEKPRLFFKDSRSILMRIIGRLLKII